VWGIRQEKVYKRRVTDLDDLKTECAKLDHAIMQLLCISGAVISQCPSQMAAVILSIVFDFNIVLQQ